MSKILPVFFTVKCSLFKLIQLIQSFKSLFLHENIERIRQTSPCNLTYLPNVTRVTLVINFVRTFLEKLNIETWRKIQNTCCKTNLLLKVRYKDPRPFSSFCHKWYINGHKIIISKPFKLISAIYSDFFLFFMNIFLKLTRYFTFWYKGSFTKYKINAELFYTK